MTTPASTPATVAPVKKVAPAKKAATPRKAAAKKTANPEFNPTVNENVKLNHATCGHPRTFAGRSACRAARRAADANK